MTPHDCVLAIVGSRDVPRYSAESIITGAILEHHPTVVVSGGAAGIDTFAREIATKMGVPVMEFVPKVSAWEAEASGSPVEETTSYGMQIVVPGGYRDRNIAVAEACTCLERLSSRTTKTYGSGWTADYAERHGKSVTRHLIG